MSRVVKAAAAMTESWPLVLLGVRIAVAAGLYLFLIVAVRALRAELRVRTTPVAMPERVRDVRRAEVAARRPPVPDPRVARVPDPRPARAPEPPAVLGPARLEVVGYELDDGASADLVGRSYALDGPALVGRNADNTIVLPEAHVSSRHARLVPDDGAWWVEDLGSTNGTYVNARRVEGRARLGASGEVRFGPVVARVVRGGAAAEPRPRGRRR